MVTIDRDTLLDILIHESPIRLKKVADRFQVSGRAVLNWINRQCKIDKEFKDIYESIEKPFIQGRLTLEERQSTDVDKGKVHALYDANWSIKDIAGDMHLTEAIVKRVLSEPYIRKPVSYSEYVGIK